ncbi:MAG: SAM-dependent methyltransferase [Phenylobacterium sp.]|jgi:SAM-dependent methyltransferase
MDPEPLARLFARDRLIRILMNFIIANYRGQENVKILDVGCGNGFITRELVNLGIKPENCTGIDLDEQLIEEARNKSPAKMNYLCQRLEDMEDKDTFNIIITSGFFAYFENPQVKQISAILKSKLMAGGLMISSNYDISWQQMEAGKLVGLDYGKDGIRSFDIHNNELNLLLQSEFRHLMRFPHTVGGHQWTQLGELITHPSKYSEFEFMLDSQKMKPTSYIDIYCPAA